MARRPRLEPVDPLPGLAPWLGGKTKLAAALSKRIERIPHTCYAEPFVGLGAAFFARRKRPKVEAVNDINGDVVTLFRVVRCHPRALIDELRFQPFARADFKRLLATEPETLTDVQRAARFVFLQRARYAGSPVSRSFPTRSQGTQALDLPTLRRRTFAAAARLSRVTIEQLAYDEFIRRYDRSTTLFYIDPPYWGCEDYYGRGIFERADFERLATLLAGVKGRFLMSINDVREIRRIFRGFKISKVRTTYSRPKMKVLPVTELIVSGGRGLA